MISIQKTVSITTDEAGQHREYHSLEELPPELRKEIQKLESEALKEGLRSVSSDGLTTTIHSRKQASLFQVKDADGNERVYHSLEEMPPEIRAALEQVQDKKRQ